METLTQTDKLGDVHQNKHLFTKLSVFQHQMKGFHLLCLAYKPFYPLKWILTHYLALIWSPVRYLHLLWTGNLLHAEQRNRCRRSLQTLMPSMLQIHKCHNVNGYTLQHFPCNKVYDYLSTRCNWDVSTYYNFLASVLSAAASFLRTGTLLRYTAAETAFKESPIFDGFKTKLKFCTST